MSYTGKMAILPGVVVGKYMGFPDKAICRWNLGLSTQAAQLVLGERIVTKDRGTERVWGWYAESVFSAVAQCGWEPDSMKEWILPSFISHLALPTGRRWCQAPTMGLPHTADSEGKALRRMNQGGAHAI